MPNNKSYKLTTMRLPDEDYKYLQRRAKNNLRSVSKELTLILQNLRNDDGSVVVSKPAVDNA